MLNQPYLLAFNASIEASCAGAADRGFAVVASEVKVPTQESQIFAELIVDIIMGFEWKSNAAVHSSATNEEALAVISQINPIINLINEAVNKMKKEIKIFKLKDAI